MFLPLPQLSELGLTMSKPETMEEKVRRLLGKIIPNVTPNSELEVYYYGQHIEEIVELALKEQKEVFIDWLAAEMSASAVHMIRRIP